MFQYLIKAILIIIFSVIALAVILLMLPLILLILCVLLFIPGKIAKFKFNSYQKPAAEPETEWTNAQVPENNADNDIIDIKANVIENRE